MWVANQSLSTRRWDSHENRFLSRTSRNTPETADDKPGVSSTICGLVQSSWMEVGSSKSILCLMHPVAQCHKLRVRGSVRGSVGVNRAEVYAAEVEKAK